MLEYEVVCAKDHIEALELQVANALEVGWQLQGGVCVSVDPASSARTYYQAMTRDDTGRRVAFSKRTKVYPAETGGD